MNKIQSRICLVALPLSMLLLLSACGDKVEPLASELSQQQPLQQKVAELLKKADAGDAEAMADLGDIYSSGEGLPKDAVRAADLFRQSAGKGIARAQFRLGQLYARGEGVPRDAVRATDLIKQSAKNDYAKAQAVLAAMYAKGDGVTRDEVLAYVWSSLAAAHGERDAKQVQESVTLNAALHDEAGRLKAKWRTGMEIVREKQEKVIPAK
jgi:uncharacterized protein